MLSGVVSDASAGLVALQFACVVASWLLLSGCVSLVSRKACVALQHKQLLPV
jgi:hypothetical protein